ncbi:UDP-N-acetylmuramoyl-L-alanyl-D-glutamate--2,6-diaminopimelate ligase [Salirhabdus salicampi]|uniref:UDP-N-acetylmuramoyl-L-alanyl-D-glutamate--2, 6-diaminopimelate ligase n=1 Tax=Salirhabdus salicampi TaxID=476102 RepID=UPI0020C27EF1|nr:UDP-N-acetylmuramoyl-L-alanyl-D-glutamate--2,6-diaminopimelate ligase [Salirhabdus salicampi]MCP8616607.1 UDP-N-acetylmuramoyl-L-alanyl-D-glutamate--2,6-diaminopimelate ligase [Salirhabdus salicampi]
MKLNQLFSKYKFYKTTNPIEDIVVHGIEKDSRQVKEGDLFICIKGYTVDGHHFVNQAVENGACAIVAERPIHANVPVIYVSNTTKTLAYLANQYYDHPSRDLRLIGITGTNGKTTMTYLLDEIFRHYEEKTGVIGTIQMKIGDEIIPVKNTTPDALFLQKSFREMVDNNVSTAIMEVSSHALDMGRVYGSDYDIAVYTNLSQDHLDYHRSMEDYLRAKTLLFSQLGNHYTGRPKFAVVNVDDPYHDTFSKSTPYEVLTYGIKEVADVRGVDISLTAKGSSFTMETPKGNVQINSPLPGEFSVYNMLAATATALCADIPLHIIKASLETTNGVPGRFETVDEGQEFGVIVDYAHTPDSLENVLKTIGHFVEGKVYVVVGCGGDRDKTKRPQMAKVATDIADVAIFTSDNPRTEDPKNILNDMVEGITNENYVVEQDRKKAIELAIKSANQGDVVLVAGKGHETYQEIGKERLPFNDRLVAQEAIKAKLKENPK